VNYEPLSKISRERAKLYLVDDELEAVYMLRIRPRRSQHGGGSLPTHEEDSFDIWE
jgi:hypothetical protein